MSKSQVSAYIREGFLSLETPAHVELLMPQEAYDVHQAIGAMLT